MDDHVNKTANDLIHLLLHQLPSIPALKVKSSRQAPIQLAQILQRSKISPIQLSILQQLPQKSITNIISKGAVKQNTTLTTLPILSTSTTSTIISIRNTTYSKGKNAPLINTSTRISTSSQQILDDLVLQYKKLDKINAVPKPIVK